MRRYRREMEALAVIASLSGVVVAGLAAWWARAAARGTGQTAAQVEHGLTFRWLCEQTASRDARMRAAGVAGLNS